MHSVEQVVRRTDVPGLEAHPVMRVVARHRPLVLLRDFVEQDADVAASAREVAKPMVWLGEEAEAEEYRVESG
jgi:hypothetical protein